MTSGRNRPEAMRRCRADRASSTAKLERGKIYLELATKPLSVLRPERLQSSRTGGVYDSI